MCLLDVESDSRTTAPAVLLSLRRRRLLVHTNGKLTILLFASIPRGGYNIIHTDVYRRAQALAHTHPPTTQTSAGEEFNNDIIRILCCVLTQYISTYLLIYTIRLSQVNLQVNIQVNVQINHKHKYKQINILFTCVCIVKLYCI